MSNANTRCANRTNNYFKQSRPQPRVFYTETRNINHKRETTQDNENEMNAW